MGANEHRCFPHLFRVGRFDDVRTLAKKARLRHGLLDWYSATAMLRIYSLDSGLRKETLMPGNLRITVDEVRKRMGAGEQFAFIDTRNPQAWGESDVKLPGAIRLLVDKLEEHTLEIPKDRPIVAYCT
jgi:hypothetical protein